MKYIAILLLILFGCVFYQAIYNKGFNQGVVQTEKCMDNWGKMKKYEDGYICVY